MYLYSSYTAFTGTRKPSLLNNAMYMHFPEIGNAIWQELCLMNVLSTEGKEKGDFSLKAHVLASDVNSRLPILFSASRNDRNTIVYIIYDSSGVKNIIE